MNGLQQLVSMLNTQKVVGQLLQSLGLQKKRNNRQRWVISFFSLVIAIVTMAFFRNQTTVDEQHSMNATEDKLNMNNSMNAGRLKPLIEMANEFAPELKK